MARYVSKFLNPSPDFSDIFDNILGDLQKSSERESYQPSKGGPRYTIDTSVLPYTAETLGYSCLSGNPEK